MRAASGMRTAAEPSVTTKAPTVCAVVASPTAIRSGMIIGASGGMNVGTTANVPSGSLATADHEPGEREPGRAEDVAVYVQGSARPGRRQAEHREREQLPEAEDAEPDHLPGQQVQ